MFGCDQYEGGFNMVSTAMRSRRDQRRSQAHVRRGSPPGAADRGDELVNEDLPVAVMHFGKASTGYSDRLQNFEPGPWGVDLTYVWIQQ